LIINVFPKLIFSYSGKEPDMEEGMAEDLLEAADKYELIRLKVNILFNYKIYF